MHFKDKVVWVTGASYGIGEEFALRLSIQKGKLIIIERSADLLFKTYNTK